MLASAPPTTRKGAVNQAEIDEAACHLFSLRGFARTSMRDIAEAIGVRAPSLYNHISSKEEVLNRILLATIHDQYKDLSDALSSKLDPIDKVRSGIASQIEFRASRSSAIVVAARETLELETETKGKFLNFRNMQYDLWEDTIKMGVNDGTFRVPSTRLAAINLYDLFNYIEINILFLEERRTIDELINWYIDLALQSLAAIGASR